MELFPAQPDLSLRISPLNTTTSSSNWRRSEEEMDNLGFWKRALDPRNSDLSLSNPSDVLHPSPHHLLHGGRFVPHGGGELEPSFLRPIRGIPVYQNPPSFPFAAHRQHLDAAVLPSSAVNHHHITTPQSFMRSRFLSRFPPKRSMRAPRMRWTTTLHSRFVHAVELLGGHESTHLPSLSTSISLSLALPTSILLGFIVFC